jgi:uncharacterized protein (TIGR00255 family)
MIRSMTGYARVERQNPQGRVSWEMRSVNHRYLDLGFKLPEEFRTLENELRPRIAAEVSRGKVEVSLRYVRDALGAAAMALDIDRLAELRAALDRVAETLGPVAVPDPVRVLAFPGVVRQEQADFSPLLDLAREGFDALLADFSATRQREGESLRQFLADRCDQLLQQVEQVRLRYPQVRDQWRERLQSRCAELGVELEPARLAQEVALAATRLDVEEELSRLGAHVAEIRKILSRREAVGRRLDFLMQELNREANTLSSKSQDAEMTRCGVDMKVLIEQMREQVQNIE